MSAEAIKITVPSLGESVSEVTLGRWTRLEGDRVEKGAPVCEIDSDKASVELSAPATGVLVPEKKEGETLRVGDVVGRIEPLRADAAASSEANEPEPDRATRTRPAAERFSPSVRRLLREHDVDPARVVGTGPRGRVLPSDVLEAAGAPGDAEGPEGRPGRLDVAEPRAEANQPHEARSLRRTRLSPLRLTLAKRLVEAAQQMALLSTFNEVDMGEVQRLRSRHGEAFSKAHGTKLGITAFFARACVIALREMPIVNAFIEGDEIVHHDYVDLGVAVSTDRGLVVPVLENAQTMSLADLEKEIQRVGEAARQGRLSVKELSGGTFTLTNGGIFGSLLSTPLVNPPQSAILGMHAIQERPVAREGEVVIRPMMYVALTYDHRLIDGKQAVTFLRRVRDLVENPAELLLIGG